MPQTQYQDLINVGGEIRTKSGKKFKDPTELAGALGIDAKTIDWTKIAKGTGYEDLTNVGGEVQTKSGQAFKTPSELAGSLGIQPHEIDWAKIAPQTAPQAPASPLGEVISQKGEEDPRQAIIKQLTEAFQNVTKGIGTVDYGARFKELREEAGLGGVSERIGTLDTEIAKTEDLLKNLEQDILERSKEELVTAPSARRLEAVERAPLVEQLGELSRSRGIESGILERGREDILTQLGLEKGETSDILSQLQTATQIAGMQQDLLATGIDTQIVDKGTSKVLINKNTGEVIKEFDVSGKPEEVSELDKARIDKIKAETAKIYNQISEDSGEQTAKDFYPPSKIDEGATNAGMTIEEFGKLPVDKASKFVRGARIIDGQVRFKTNDKLESKIDEKREEGFSYEEIAEGILEDSSEVTPADKMVALQYLDKVSGTGTTKDYWLNPITAISNIFK